MIPSQLPVRKKQTSSSPNVEERFIIICANGIERVSGFQGAPLICMPPAALA